MICSAAGRPKGANDVREPQKFKITKMQQAVSSTFKNPDHDPLADDIDLLGLEVLGRDQTTD